MYPPETPETAPAIAPLETVALEDFNGEWVAVKGMMMGVEVSLESLGMLAVKMVPDCFGFDILWSDGKSIPQYYLLVGGLLTR